MPELRSPKIVYDVLNISEPTLKGAAFVVMVMGSRSSRMQGKMPSLVGKEEICV